MNENRNATLDEYLRGLEGLDYPASRSAIINRAADTGGLDAEVQHVLSQLHDRTYGTRDDVLRAVREIVARGSTLSGAGAAAPSQLDDREKNLVKEMADPRRDQRYIVDGGGGDTDRR